VACGRLGLAKLGRVREMNIMKVRCGGWGIPMGLVIFGRSAHAVSWQKSMMLALFADSVNPGNGTNSALGPSGPLGEGAGLTMAQLALCLVVALLPAGVAFYLGRRAGRKASSRRSQ
jgi:hypothetical protein